MCNPALMAPNSMVGAVMTAEAMTKGAPQTLQALANLIELAAGARPASGGAERSAQTGTAPCRGRGAHTHSRLRG